MCNNLFLPFLALGFSFDDVPTANQWSLDDVGRVILGVGDIVASGQCIKTIMEPWRAFMRSNSSASSDLNHSVSTGMVKKKIIFDLLRSRCSLLMKLFTKHICMHWMDMVHDS